MPILAISHLLVLQFTSYWPLLLACVLNGYVFGIVVAQTPAIMLDVVGMDSYLDGMALAYVFYGFGNLFGGSIGGKSFRSCYPIPFPWYKRILKQRENFLFYVDQTFVSNLSDLITPDMFL